MRVSIPLGGQRLACSSSYIILDVFLCIRDFQLRNKFKDFYFLRPLDLGQLCLWNICVLHSTKALEYSPSFRVPSSTLAHLTFEGKSSLAPIKS